MDGIRSDLRQTIRGLATNRGYAAVTVVTLALGIGANTAVFNLANWLLLRPVPGVSAPDELVTVGFGSEGARGPVAFLDLQSLRAGMPAVAGLAGATQGTRIRREPPMRQGTSGESLAR